MLIDDVNYFKQNLKVRLVKLFCNNFIFKRISSKDNIQRAKETQSFDVI